MHTRAFTRARVVARALLAATARRPPPQDPRRVLIVHHPKMIGDTLLLAHLAAKARVAWPRADIVMAVSRATEPIFARRPWGIEARAYEPYDSSTLAHFTGSGHYDIAFVPGDNRYGWFARAVGARWIVGFAGERPPYKDWLLDELHDYPATPGTWGDMAAGLITGEDPPPYDPSQWPAPPFAPYEAPSRPYAVLHLGASTTLKLWLPERWAELADALEARGLEVVWSAGGGEEHLVAEADPQSRRRSYAGRLDLAQVWNLFENASLIVTPDTGLAHLARLTFTPTAVLFGPGTPQLVGLGRFFRNAPWKAVIVDPFPCRDQHILFRRELPWVRRCSRTTRECAAPRCLHAIDVAAVLRAIDDLAAPRVAPARVNIAR